MDECRYCRAPGHVLWNHPTASAYTRTCYHCARTRGPIMVDAGWVRLVVGDWLPEPARTVEA